MYKHYRQTPNRGPYLTRKPTSQLGYHSIFAIHTGNRAATGCLHLLLHLTGRERSRQFTLHRFSVRTDIVPGSIIFFIIDRPFECGTLESHDILHRQLFYRDDGERIGAERFHILRVLIEVLERIVRMTGMPVVPGANVS